eukprot:g8069.t1
MLTFAAAWSDMVHSFGEGLKLGSLFFIIPGAFIISEIQAARGERYAGYDSSSCEDESALINRLAAIVSFESVYNPRDICR